MPYSGCSVLHGVNLNFKKIAESSLNLRSHPTMTLRIEFKDLNFQFFQTSPETILNILKGLNLSKARYLLTYLTNF